MARAEKEFCNDLTKDEQDGDCQEEDYYDDDFEDEDITERIAELESNGGMASGSIEIEEGAFGPKIRRRKKKMETRLLKEILNDFSFKSVKRYS